MGDSSMASNTDFEIWNHNDRGGVSDRFTGAQGQDNITGNTDSLETAANTWVIVFNEKDYTGNCLQTGPSTYRSDLNHVTRYNSSGVSQGDWKNQIKSFILYKSKPAYWGRNPTTDELFDPGIGKVILTEDDHFKGNNRTFSGPYSGVNLGSIGYTTDSTKMDSSVNSLRTGSNSWVSIFDDTDGNGAALKVNPSTKYSQLGNVSRRDLDGNILGDWKNQIDSFLLYTQKPTFWDTSYPRPYIDFDALFNLYPGTTNCSSDGKIIYVIEDAAYTVNQPELTLQAATQSWSGYQGGYDLTVLPTDGWTQYTVSLEHKNTAGRNDHASFAMFFDNSGNLVSIQEFEWSSDGAYNISDQLITIVDDEVGLLGAIGALETLGISEEAADAFTQIFDFVTRVFNEISALVYHLTNNGGRYYFLPVICHTINRICTTVMNGFNLETYSSSSDSRNSYQLDFDYGSYLNALTETSTSISSAVNWTQKSGSQDTMSQVMEYQYQGYHYRTWYQEVSFSMELGIMVSCKIDYEIDDTKDDHIILLMGFSIPSQGQSVPTLCFAQGTIQFTDESNSNIMTTPCIGSGAIEAVYSQLAQGISGISISSSEEGRNYLANVAEANMQAMANCVRFIPS